MPERVGEKRKANHAYPIGGEYVIDIDDYLHWRPHYHYVGRDGACCGCLAVSRNVVLRLLDKIRENYSDVHVIFSGNSGFHIHVLDFDVRDWTHYNDRDPIKTHEVARFLYTKHIKAGCGGFDRHHFTLSGDPMRVISFPESLNGQTGLMCISLGDPKSFERTGISDIIWKSKASWHFYNREFENMNHSHPESALHVVGDDL
jgi:hypothetical protein